MELGSIIMYLIIAVSIIVFSVLTVTTRKILRSATYLLFALFATSALYFQLDYEFLGAVQIAVYAGGIVVLFVFSILLTSHPGENSKPLVSKSRVLGIAAAVLTLAVTLFALFSRCAEAMKTMPEMAELKMSTVGESLLGSGKYGYLLPFEAVSILLLACIIGGIVVARKR